MPQGATVIMPDALLDEVTALVEWPAVYAGTFDRAFLAVPQECLILTMQQNQKYFALADASGALTHRFLIVSAISRRATRRRSSTATSACCARGSPTRASSSTRTARQPLAARVAQLAQRRLSQQARHARRRASSGCAFSRATSARSIGADARAVPIAPRCSRRPISSPTWSASFPSCRERWAATTRMHDGEAAAGRRRDRAALLAALCRRRAARSARSRRRRARRQARNAGGHVRHRRSCPPATRIRSACAARRSACCAS